MIAEVRQCFRTPNSGMRSRFAALLSCVFLAAAKKYEPTWDSIDSRPLPDWYDDSKLGIFCHWGVYSVPAYRSEWFWWYWQGPNADPNVAKFMQSNYPPRQTYADFAKDFTAEYFNADEFRDIVEASGARYFVFTSKHHEGFTMWPSKTAFNWNALAAGPKRDIVGELKKSFSKSKKVHFGLYFSLFEWFNPKFLEDSAKNTTRYVQEVSWPQLQELVLEYEPEVIWSDGDWDKTDEYWRSKEFLAWLYNDSPVKDKVAVNDRWGHDISGKHGGFMTYADHYDPGKLQSRKWENCLTLDKESWGNRRGMKSEDVHTVYYLIEQTIRTIACGGNILINVGPNSSGKIPAIFEDRLREMGAFVKANEDAIYSTKPWVYQNDTEKIWYTSRLRSANLPVDRVFNPQNKADTIIYAWILDTKKVLVELTSVRANSKTIVRILDGAHRLESHVSKTGRLVVDLTAVPWPRLTRTDVLVLQIEFADTVQHNPLTAIAAEENLFREIVDYWEN